MAFTPLNTKDETTSFRKTLLIGVAGWGKTTQARHYKRHYGKGFIISGESGLSSIRSEGIDYLPFTSFDGPVDHAAGVYSFVEICKLIMSPEFKAAGYKWIMLDSLTELSDLTYAWADAKSAATAAATGKKQNGFEVWGELKDKMIGACKFIRDLPYHVIVTSLEKSSDNENGEAIYLPLVQGNAIQAQIPGIFDNVLYGVTATVKEADKSVTKRFILTGPYNGRNAKVRDESGSVNTVEETGDVTTILLKMDTSK
jgi:hypothetical protein